MNFLKKWRNVILATVLILIGFVSLIADSYAFRRSYMSRHSPVMVSSPMFATHSHRERAIAPSYRNHYGHWVGERRE
ncbi:MAG: hypothetical protein P1U74_07965 [Legionellaceae bacterium]|nr:hypothetical protein [Legionellaceae bacterium]